MHQNALSRQAAFETSIHRILGGLLEAHGYWLEPADGAWLSSDGEQGFKVFYRRQPRESDASDIDYSIQISVKHGDLRVECAGVESLARLDSEDLVRPDGTVDRKSSSARWLTGAVDRLVRASR